MRGYTTREVAEVLGLPASRILSWTRSGLLEPRRGPRGAFVFSFQDIVLLRTARSLLDAAVPARKVRRALAALREQLPTGRPLSAVTITALGDRLLVRDSDAVWEPDSGQLLLDLPVADLAAEAAPVARRALATRGGGDADLTAEEWFDTALDLEAVSPEQACAAYRRALELDPTFADAHLNLGRLLHETGDLAGAEGCYRAAIRHDPAGGRGHYNLGVVFEDRGRREEALEAYEEAVRREPDLAAAHFNLSRLHEAAGRPAEALQHLVRYKQLMDRPEG